MMLLSADGGCVPSSLFPPIWTLSPVIPAIPDNPSCGSHGAWRSSNATTHNSWGAMFTSSGNMGGLWACDLPLAYC
eukprot:7850869-Pyramimonas_sp.AAC.1